MISRAIDRCWALLCALTVSVAAVAPAASQQSTDQESLRVVMYRLLIDLPINIAVSEPVRRPLEELAREPCDQKAIEELGNALDKVGRRREAANAYTSFSATCAGHHAPSLRHAVNILLTLSDYQRAASVASDLIALEPFNDNGYFLRAVAYDRGGSTRQAIDDYISSLELFGNKERISSVSYMNLARAYEKLGQFCAAVGPIEDWIAIDPVHHETSQTRAIISDYTAKGHCQADAGGEEKFPRVGSTVKLQVAVNGVRGNFVLDTGAAYVSLTMSFAQKAKVEIEPDSLVHLSTANGASEGKRGRAATIALRSLSAKDVQVIVQADAKGLYGDGIDGLLGMSFLSRFEVQIAANFVEVRTRQAKRP